jgi:hypothetical protein
MWTLK